MRALLGVLVVAGCTNVAGGPADPPPIDPPVPREHDARFVGLWAVEQPLHALYEVTYYAFGSDGTLHAVVSDPADCGGHLREHCVTGSVANCVPTEPQSRCTGAITCVFGGEWFSRGSSTLVIVGDCSDDTAREIVIEMAADASSNTGWGGAGGTLTSVGGSDGWSHDNWDWSFRKCRAGSVPTTCVPE
ncbi:MAG: hypothetical protein H0T42_09895 [Deltaproteobacteria bacterium]|nr:hypothetical protein [Deltaproteobacteria bacterium]